MQAPDEATHVSKNRLEGSLGDTSLDQLLAECHKHMVTGTITVHGNDALGTVDLRVGFVDSAAFGDLADDTALDAMGKLSDGEYELVQRLPDLDGALGSAAQLDGSTATLPLVKLMQHCEDNALSCTITIISDFDRGEIGYRAGEIVDVTLNGRRDDDSIVDMLRFSDARFRVSAPPLDLGMSGWPSVAREPTAPFTVDDAKKAEAETDKPVEAKKAEKPRRKLWVVLDVAIAVALAAAGIGYIIYVLGPPWGPWR
jgi:hypothetical protein